MQHITGRWKLDTAQSTDQKQMLKLMGRPFWQISVINNAEEDFRLFHFAKTLEGQIVHYFDKHVTIYLTSTFLQVMSKILRIEFDKVRYKHKLVANGRKKAHPDDEKQFGPCESVTTSAEDGFTIRWYLKKGLLKVFHFVDGQDRLNVRMQYSVPSGKMEEATKIYHRVPFTEEDQRYLDRHAEKAHVIH